MYDSKKKVSSRDFSFPSASTDEKAFVYKAAFFVVHSRPYYGGTKHPVNNDPEIFLDVYYKKPLSIYVSHFEVKKENIKDGIKRDF